jgi:Flp pilus assembly secretin CpaC
MIASPVGKSNSFRFPARRSEKTLDNIGKPDIVCVSAERHIFLTQNIGKSEDAGRSEDEDEEKMSNPTDSHETQDQKLAALILANIPESSFTVTSPSDSIIKSFKISFPQAQAEAVAILIQAYNNCEAKVNLFRYNKYFNLLRDIIKGKIQC